MQLKYLAFLVAFYFVYLVIGAAIFQSIEQPLEDETCEHAKNFVESLQLQYSSRNLCLNATELNISEMLLSVAKFRQQGIDFFLNVSENGRNIAAACPHNWNFENALFFCGTVVTTIGYGNVSPTTNVSRAICVVYAIIGIVIFAAMFNGLSDLFSRFIERLAGRVDRLDMRKWTRNLVIFTIFATVGSTLFCFLPGIMFSAVEGWSYEISVYYTIITLTTIGFGDYVAGKNPKINYFLLYRILVYFWILFGLAYMATFVRVLSDRLKHRSKALIKQRRSKQEENDCPQDDDEEEEEDEMLNESDGTKQNITEILVTNSVAADIKYNGH